MLSIESDKPTTVFNTAHVNDVQMITRHVAVTDVTEYRGSTSLWHYDQN